MARIIVDTSVIIDFIRYKDKSKTIFHKLNQNNDVYISIITHSELYAGKSVWEKSKARIILEKILSNLYIVGISENISILAGKISFEYNTSIVDAVIAATAISNKFPLATLNLKDFEKINGLSLYKV